MSKQNKSGEKKYYDPSELLSQKDVNGNLPEIFMCTSNRSGGKTTAFNRLVVNRFLKRREKFMLLYRYNYELDDVAEQFFSDIKVLFFPNHEMTSEKKARGIYHELLLDGVPCGYAVSMNSADQIKKKSHLFSDTTCILFDEFQSETNHYCPGEVRKFISIHTSVARGNGNQVRYLPVYMISNPVSILNPYYVEMGICDRLREDTNFLRGNGWVLENGFVKQASDAQKASGFNAAFADNRYVAYAAQNVYLNDTSAFIEKPQGRSRYLCTLLFEGKEYGVRSFDEQGFIYVSTKSDKTCKERYTVTATDHTTNAFMVGIGSWFLRSMRTSFESGCMRFQNMRCKSAALAALSYKYY